MGQPEDLLLVFVTVPTRDAGEALARVLLDASQVACVNIVPGIRSLYLWQSKLEEADEHLLLLKTRSEHYAEVERLIVAHHPYEVPEVIAVDVARVSEPYRRWVLSVTERIAPDGGRLK